MGEEEGIEIVQWVTFRDTTENRRNNLTVLCDSSIRERNFNAHNLHLKF